MVRASNFCLSVEINFKLLGDSGGALQTLRDGQWILEGLTSFGIVPCGSGRPSVFTRITSHLEWILSNME